MLRMDCSKMSVKSNLPLQAYARGPNQPSQFATVALAAVDVDIVVKYKRLLPSRSRNMNPSKGHWQWAEDEARYTNKWCI